MGCRGLFIFLEGEDDKRFFEKIIVPKFEERYDFVKIISYAKMKKQKIDGFLKSIKSTGFDYIFVTDINNKPCVTAKKQELETKLRNIDQDKVVVVIREIESWYLAGLDESSCKKLRIRNVTNTNTIDKERFNDIIPKYFDSRIDFMLEILKEFSTCVAKEKNVSFKYFCSKYNI